MDMARGFSTGLCQFSKVSETQRESQNADPEMPESVDCA